MSILFNHNIINYKSLNISYNKLKINYLFSNFRYIIFINLNNNLNFKNKLLFNDILSVNLNKKYIKSLFNISSYSFLKNNKFTCIFIKNEILFLDLLKNIGNKQFFYSYKNCLSNIIINENILNEYNKYNKNYIYIQFILKKIKIKIIILLLFFLISIIKYIK